MYRGLLAALREVDRRVAAHACARDNLAVSFALAFSALHSRTGARLGNHRNTVGLSTEYPSEGHLVVFSHAEEILIATAGPRCALDAPALIAGHHHGAIIPPGSTGGDIPTRRPVARRRVLNSPDARRRCLHGRAHGCNSFQPSREDGAYTTFGP